MFGLSEIWGIMFSPSQTLSRSLPRPGKPYVQRLFNPHLLGIGEQHFGVRMFGSDGDLLDQTQLSQATLHAVVSLASGFLGKSCKSISAHGFA